MSLCYNYLFDVVYVSKLVFEVSNFDYWTIEN